MQPKDEPLPFFSHDDLELDFPELEVIIYDKLEELKEDVAKLADAYAEKLAEYRKVQR